MNDDHAFDEPLRRALQAAGDAVDPAADGLDRIWAKTRAWRTERPVRYGLAAAVWRLSPVLPRGPGLRAWGFAAARWIADAFRADADQPGRLGWLRPAAALTTALFVATGTAWAITTLPQVLTSATGNSRSYLDGTGGPPGPGGSPLTSGVSPAGQSGGPSRSGSGTPSPSPTCSSTVPFSSTLPSPSPTNTSSASPSPTPTGSGNGSSSPSATPSAGATSASPSSSAAPPPPGSTVSPTPTASPPASSSASPGPCG